MFCLIKVLSTQWGAWYLFHKIEKMAKKKSKKKQQKELNKFNKHNAGLKTGVIDTKALQPSFIQKLKNIALQPINLLIIRFLLAMIVFYILWATPFFQEYVIKNIAIAYAKVSSILLNIMGYGVSTSNDTIVNSVFSISIKNGCDGVEGLALYVCALLVYPSSIPNKLKGMFWGISFLVVLNIIRIVSLYMIGIHVPALFDVMHESIWQVLFIVFSLVALLVFINQTKEYSILKK